MDLIRIISELHKERAAVEDALVYLEQLARTQGKRRGRPPAYLTGKFGKPSAGRRRFSEATRRKMAASQKKRWAEFKKAQKSS
jgi:hypothetical protein